MEDLIQWFIETSSKDGNHLAGMLFAALCFGVLFAISVYKILELLIGWFRKIKPIKINKVEKRYDNIIDFPPEVEKSFEEVFKRLDAIDKKIK